jgi:hypothetical protein
MFSPLEEEDKKKPEGEMGKTITNKYGYTFILHFICIIQSKMTTFW